MGDGISISGITQGQASQIIFAYENDAELKLSLKDIDIHIFSKKKRNEHKKLVFVKCITIHTRYFNFAIFDYNLMVVGTTKNRKLLKIKANKNDKESLSIFVR